MRLEWCRFYVRCGVNRRLMDAVTVAVDKVTGRPTAVSVPEATEGNVVEPIEVVLAAS